MKYKLDRKDFQIWGDDIFLLPTFRLVVDDAAYIRRNFSISFYWLVFHARLLFMEK